MRKLTYSLISPDGKLLAFGSSDLTVGVVDAQTFAVRIARFYATAFRLTVISLDSLC